MIKNLYHHNLAKRGNKSLHDDVYCLLSVVSVQGRYYKSTSSVLYILYIYILYFTVFEIVYLSLYLTLLQQPSQPTDNMNGASVDPEKEWMEKLFDENFDEFCESFGVYDGK